jgi:hypothetical protein
LVEWGSHKGVCIGVDLFRIVEIVACVFLVTFGVFFSSSVIGILNLPGLLLLVSVFL